MCLPFIELVKKIPTDTSDRRNILMKLSNLDTKNDLILSCKRAKPNGLYVNEDLTPVRAKILYTIRQAKKKLPHKIAGHGSINGRVTVHVIDAS